MSEQAVKNAILAPMQRLFLPPLRMDENQQLIALAEYVESLQQYSEEILQEAWRRVRDSYLKGSWPAVALFKNEARKYYAEKFPQERNAKAQTVDDSWTKSWKNWEKVRLTPQAAYAAREGYSWSLKCKVLEGAAPGSITMSDLAAGHMRALRLYDQLTNEDGLVNGKPMKFVDRELAISMYRNIMVREAETAQEIGDVQEKFGQTRPEASGYNPPRPEPVAVTPADFGF